MYTLTNKYNQINKRILNLARKLKFLELKAAMVQDNFFGSNLNEFTKFHK
jgi:hypothetical protein